MNYTVKREEVEQRSKGESSNIETAEHLLNLFDLHSNHSLLQNSELYKQMSEAYGKENGLIQW